MYEKINQIVLNDKRINVYAIFDNYSKSYLYDLLLLEDKTYKKFLKKEIIKMVLIGLGLLTVLGLIIGPIIHAVNSGVMLTENIVSVTYIILWTFLAVAATVLVLLMTIEDVSPLPESLRFSLDYFKEENLVFTCLYKMAHSGDSPTEKRNYVFSRLNNYQRTAKSKEKSFAFVAYLQSLSVSELERIFQNSSKKKKLFVENKKIETLLKNDHYAQGFANDLRNKLKDNSDRIAICEFFIQDHETKIKDLYEQSLKSKNEKEIMDLLAS